MVVWEWIVLNIWCVSRPSRSSVTTPDSSITQHGKLMTLSLNRNKMRYCGKLVYLYIIQTKKNLIGVGAGYPEVWTGVVGIHTPATLLLVAGDLQANLFNSTLIVYQWLQWTYPKHFPMDLLHALMSSSNPLFEEFMLYVDVWSLQLVPHRPFKNLISTLI